MLYKLQYDAPVGPLTLASDGESLLGLWLPSQKYYGGVLENALAQATQDCDALPVFEAARHWLNRYFVKERPAPQELPLAPVGTPFQQAVWKMLCEIPYGETVSYGALAQRVAAQVGKKRMSAQAAVGGAVGHNPVSIIIPCHRVVGAQGSLTGYAGGLDKKIWLLKHEGVETKRFQMPKTGTAL